MYLYVMQNEHYYKIGISKEPLKRLENIKNANPKKVILIITLFVPEPIVSVKFLEEFLHKQYQIQRGRGEWFDFSGGELRLLVHDLLIMQKGFVSLMSLVRYPQPLLNFWQSETEQAIWQDEAKKEGWL